MNDRNENELDAEKPKPEVLHRLICNDGFQVSLNGKELDVNGLIIPIDSLRELREYLRRDGKLEIANGTLSYDCVWCGKKYERALQAVCRGSVNSLRYCSQRCRDRVTNLKSNIRRVYLNSGRDELSSIDIAARLREIENTRVTPEKMEEYLKLSGIAERGESGLYRLAGAQEV